METLNFSSIASYQNFLVVAAILFGAFCLLQFSLLPATAQKLATASGKAAVGHGAAYGFLDFLKTISLVLLLGTLATLGGLVYMDGLEGTTYAELNAQLALLREWRGSIDQLGVEAGAVSIAILSVVLGVISYKAGGGHINRTIESATANEFARIRAGLTDGSPL